MWDSHHTSNDISIEIDRGDVKEYQGESAGLYRAPWTGQAQVAGSPVEPP